MSKPLWAYSGFEPPVSEMLTDPIVCALMKADGIRHEELVALIRRMSLPAPSPCGRSSAAPRN